MNRMGKYKKGLCPYVSIVFRNTIIISNIT